jgi:hypothetical protein
LICGHNRYRKNEQQQHLPCLKEALMKNILSLFGFSVPYVIVIAISPVVAQVPPVLDSIGPKTAVVDVQLKFTVSASHPDSPPFLVEGSLPAGATFDGFVVDSNTRTGTFKWTPVDSQIGIYYATFYASYGGLYDSETVAIDVKEAGYDPGFKDTVELVVAVQPQEDSGQLNVVLELYAFNDSSLTGATAGFSWDNPNLRMDSAVAAQFIIDLGTNFGPFLYEDDNIDTSNANQRFVFAWAQQTGQPLPPSNPTRRLWATYYFSLTDWNATDSIVIDSILVPPSSYLLFTVAYAHLGQIQFIPYWKGAVVVKDATDVEVIDDPNVPRQYALSQNYPNPFNPVTQINFDLPVRSHVTLTVYNVLGQQVTTLVDQEMSANRYVVDWDGTSVEGRKVASGIYFYRLQAGDFIQTKKMMLLK